MKGSHELAGCAEVLIERLRDRDRFLEEDVRSRGQVPRSVQSSNISVGQSGSDTNFVSCCNVFEATT